MNGLWHVLLGTVCLALLGCGKAEEAAKTVTPRSTDLGTGLNAVERSYPRPVSEMIEIARYTLTSFDLRMKDDRHDALGGELSATRADGHTVNVRVTAVDQDRSQVSVWVAPGNRPLAELIQQRIADKSAAAKPGTP
jgi:hypothetical protein